MSTFLVDTSCMVPVVLTWHEHHDAAVGEIGRRLGLGERMVVAAPALVEAYAVLTRLPTPYRLSPPDALAVLETSFLQHGELVALDASTYRDLLHRAPSDGIAGGRTFDAVIAACAHQARVATLLTFNDRHFRPFAVDGLRAVVPEA